MDFRSYLNSCLGVFFHFTCSLWEHFQLLLIESIMHIISYRHQLLWVKHKYTYYHKFLGYVIKRSSWFKDLKHFLGDLDELGQINSPNIKLIIKFNFNSISQIPCGLVQITKVILELLFSGYNWILAGLKR